MSALIRICSENNLNFKNSQIKYLFDVAYYLGNGRKISIDNDLNLSDGNYLFKIKNKNNISDHVVFDTVRGITKEIYKNKAIPQVTEINGLEYFSSSGFILGNSKSVNNLNDNYVAVTFKKASKFFDIVKYTGNGVKNRAIPHSLQSEIGLISIKALDIYSNWIVRHKDAIGELSNEQPYQQSDGYSQITDISNTHFTVSYNANLTGVEYVAYIYAHDPSLTGKIQCGSYVGGYQEVSNTVTGEGSFQLPDDVTEITITAKGGTGGNNCWYDPGQPYKLGTPEQVLIPAIYGWKYIDDYSITTAPVINLEMWNNFSHIKSPEPSVKPSKPYDPNDRTTVVSVEWWTGTMNNPVFNKGNYVSYLIDPGQPYKAAVPDQPYIPPTSGGGIFSGEYSKISVNDILYVFQGGHGGPAVAETKNLSTSDSKIINYEIGSGGSLTYSYKTGGNTNVRIKFKHPPIKFSTNLTNKGSLTIPKGVKEIKIACSGGVGRNDTYISFGQPYIPPTVLFPGQPYIPPTPGFPGQPYIAPSTKVIPEVNLPARWVYTDWEKLGKKYIPQTDSYEDTDYFKNIDVYSEVVKAEEDDYKIFHPGLSNEFKMYSFQPPGDKCYKDHPYIGTPPILGYVSLATERKWFRRRIKPNLQVEYIEVNQSWRNAEYVPEHTVYDPGQPYLPPEPDDPGQPYIPPVYSDLGQPYIPPVYCNPGQPYIPPTPYDPGQIFIKDVEAQEYIPAFSDSPGQPYIEASEGQPYIAPTLSTPGQPYIPPTIGVGDVRGESSYLSINNQTFTYIGSLGYTEPDIRVDTLTLNSESSQSLVYNVASSGYLNISYDIPNYDTSSETEFLPRYLIIKKISGEGDWYEIDGRKDKTFLKENKPDLEINQQIVIINKDGFSPCHITTNELDQLYVYMIIRDY